MNDEATLLKRQYQREWRAKNKDKVKQHNERYWERKAAKTNNEPENRKER